MPDEKAASSPADKFYQPEAASAPAEEKDESAVTSESAPDPKSEGDEPETASGSEPEKTEPHSPKAQARIKQLLARNKELEQQLDTYKRPVVKAEVLTQPEMPDPSKFETLEALRAADAEYHKKQTAFEIQKALQDDRAQQAKLAKEATVEQINKNLEDIWQKREKAVIKRHADYVQTVYEQADNGSLKIKVRLNATADGFLLDSDIGPELLLHLAKHPEDAERIYDLNPHQTARALTKLEDKLADGLKVPRKLTNAPDPPKDVGGRGAATVTAKSLEDIFYPTTAGR